jgi:TetR/AcrR family transcriptional regulator, tetracycline repressor protein
VSRGKREKQNGFGRFRRWSDRESARTRVTRDQVVRRALDVLQAEGFDGLTMRRLAERLGIKAASLYNHVSDKDELLALMADAICAEIPELDRSRPWREQVETMALHVWRVLMAHRDGARVLAATPPVGRHRLRLIEQNLHALISAGLAPARVADASFVLNSYVVGFVLDEAHGNPRDSAIAQRMREEGRRWFKSLPRQQYPTLVALADEIIDSPAERRFKVGLRALLDGFEQGLERKGRRC